MCNALDLLGQCVTFGCNLEKESIENIEKKQADSVMHMPEKDKLGECVGAMSSQCEHLTHVARVAVETECAAVYDSVDLQKPHSKELSIGKAVTNFRFYKSMTRDARGKDRRLSRGSLCRHQVLLEPGHSFMSPKSWIPQDWQSPLNWAPSNNHLSCLTN